MVPAPLRVWFFIHFLVDYIFGLPLLFAPKLVLGFFGWGAVDPVASRLVGAALLAVGSASLFYRKADVATYRTLLGIKMLWAYIALLAFFLSFREAHRIIILPAGIFAFFAVVWTYFYARLTTQK